MAKRIYILMSVPEGFYQKMKNNLKNLNKVNSDTNPIRVEDIYYSDDEYAISPKNKNIDFDNQRK